MYTGPNIVTDGLVLHLDAANAKSYPGTGTTWSDLSGNGNGGTLINGPTFDSGNNGSIVFDGVNDYASSNNSLGNGWNEITVSTWVKPSQLLKENNRRYYLINADDNSSSGEESVFNMFFSHVENPTYYSNNFNGQYIVFGIRSINQENRERPITTVDNTLANEYIVGSAFGQDNLNIVVHKWVNCTGTYNGNETKIYINGILKGTSNNQPDGVNRSVSGALNTSSRERMISHNSNNTDFSGKISNIKIYNRALTDQEILQNYNATKSRFNL